MRPPAREDGGSGAEQNLIPRIREQLDLDKDQLAEFDRIAAEFNEKRGGQAVSKRQQALIEEMRRARQAGDEERAAEIREQLRESRRGGRMQEFFDEIEGILRDDQLRKLGEIREHFAQQRRGGGRGPLAQLSQLRGELNLSERQARRYDALYDELEAQLQRGRAGGDGSEDEIVRKIREAAEAGDDDSVKELAKQLPDARGRTSQAITGFLDEVQSFLEPEQVETLERFRQGLNQEGRRTDLRACFRFVSRLDLEEDQRVALRELQREARELQREARRDPDARAQINEDVRRQLREILTPEQAAEFDEWLAGQDSGKRGRDQRGDRPRRNREREPRGRRGGERP
jgi:hypothetical protein